MVNKKKEMLVGRNIRDIDHPFLQRYSNNDSSRETDPAHDQVQASLNAPLRGRNTIIN